MATFYLAAVHLAAPHGPANSTAVIESGSTVANAAVNVAVSTTVSPSMSYDDLLSMLAAITNYVRTDRSLASASRVLNLKIP